MQGGAREEGTLEQAGKIWARDFEIQKSRRWNFQAGFAPDPGGRFWVVFWGTGPFPGVTRSGADSGREVFNGKQSEGRPRRFYGGGG